MARLPTPGTATRTVATRAVAPRGFATRTFVIVGVAVTFLLAFAVAPHASSQPDGLEKVAAENRLDLGATDHPLGDSPLAEYSVQGVDNASLSTGLSGIAGVAATFAVGIGLFGLIRWNRRRRAPGVLSPASDLAATPAP